MPTAEHKEEQDQNLYAQITVGIDEAVKQRKQREFDALTEEIDQVFQGNIGNFYQDDFPQDQSFGGEQALQEIQAALGENIQVQDLEEASEESSERRSQRKLICVKAIQGAAVRQPILECDPIVTVVDMFAVNKYCSYCFKQNNPRPAQEDPSDPDSFVPHVTLRACAQC